MNEILQELPAIPLRGLVLLPGVVTHFDISGDKPVRAVEEAIRSGGRVFLVTQKNDQTSDPGEADVYRVGIIADVKQIMKLKNEVIRVIVEGRRRAELVYFIAQREYLKAQVIVYNNDEQDFPADTREAMRRNLQEELDAYLAANPNVAKELKGIEKSRAGLSAYMDRIGTHLPLPVEKKQEILEAVSVRDRYDILSGVLTHETTVSRIRNEIREKTKEKLDKNQKEYILREQMKVIREELGEEDLASEADRFSEKVQTLVADDSVKERLTKEISRYRAVANNPAEATVVRNWIELALELPWNKKAEANTDLRHARTILEEDHYGLDKVKDRVLEFLAVRSLTHGGECPILCLVGPPGTGKTSIAQSVARALAIPYVRICLGGVRDEAEIRGHRRTYVGAMPGRIIQGLKNAGAANPLMLLDEIDKMSSDYRGDTASAMLEVLDSAQNSHFNDHYVDMPVDLSEVLFIATANDMQSIPKPLLDRMEVIEVSSYTANEKWHIAREHLLDKQLHINGLKPEQLTISDDALRAVIESYTREAGVRNLERKIGEICRKTAREIYEEGASGVSVEVSNLEHFLGKVRYRPDEKNEEDEIGVVRGLAWTSVGGTTLEIEVGILPGKGALRLTGQMGDVMKESAQTGVSYVRSVSESYGIDADFFSTHDIHVHIPEGAVPKDGPSAGITMATAILSAVTNHKVRADLAMTGEITLRGRVLPVGGLKEKLLAAGNAGIAVVCVPEKNRPDIEEIDAEITDGMDIRYVGSMDQVIANALL